MARPPPGESRCPAAIGSVPLAASGGTVKAGTITWALAPDTAPDWILPVVPVAANSVFNNFTFIWEMWRPLYWTVNGVVPELNPSMSIASPAVYSNGNKTVTISLKRSYKWSNGQPMPNPTTLVMNSSRRSTRPGSPRTSSARGR
jgi:peptide/nickel transport system substrate-binding protein